MLKFVFFNIFLINCVYSQVNLVDRGWELDITITSFHYSRTYLNSLTPTRYNEFNPGLFVQYDFGRYRTGLGYFVNSYGRHSIGVLAGLDYYTRLTLNLGLLSGYKDTDMGRQILPLIMLSYDVGLFKVGISPMYTLLTFNIEL